MYETLSARLADCGLMRWSLGSTKQITKVHHLLQDSTCSALNDWPRIPFSKNQIIITIKTFFFIFLMLKFVPQNIRKENILIDFLFLAILNPTENNRRRLHIGNIYFLRTFPPIAPDSSFSHYLQTPFRPPDIHWTLHFPV